MDLGVQMSGSLSFTSGVENANAAGGSAYQSKGKNVWNYFTNNQFLHSVVEKAKVMQ